MDYLSQYSQAVKRLGFNRETDRLASTFLTPFRAFGADIADGGLDSKSTVPSEAIGSPTWNTSWIPPALLDQDVKNGVVYDIQMVAHCGSPSFADSTDAKRIAGLQRMALWLGVIPVSTASTITTRCLPVGQIPRITAAMTLPGRLTTPRRSRR